MSGSNELSNSFSEDATHQSAPTTDYEAVSTVTVQFTQRTRYFDACRICGELHAEHECPMYRKVKCYFCGKEHTFQNCPVYQACPVCGKHNSTAVCDCGYPNTVCNLNFYVSQCWKCGRQHSALVCPEDTGYWCASCNQQHDTRSCANERHRGRMDLSQTERERLYNELRRTESRFISRSGQDSGFRGGKDRPREPTRRIVVPPAQEPYRLSKTPQGEVRYPLQRSRFEQ